MSKPVVKLMPGGSVATSQNCSRFFLVNIEIIGYKCYNQGYSQMQKCLDQGLGTLKKQGGLVYVWKR